MEPSQTFTDDPLRVLRAVLLHKNPGYRPLGIKEAECRVGSACVATHKKLEWNATYTSELPEVTELRRAKITAAEQRVHTLEGAVASVATRASRVAATARAELASAVHDLELARAPANFPVQLVFAPNGAELAAHTARGVMAKRPDWTVKGTDSFNMFNECVREATFRELQERDAEVLPVFTMLYAEPAEIYLDRGADGTVMELEMHEVCDKADRLGAREIAGAVDPDAAMAEAIERDAAPALRCMTRSCDLYHERLALSHTIT